MPSDRSSDLLFSQLRERAKELNCLYAVQELINNPENSLEKILQELTLVLPRGWQYPDICKVEIICGDTTYASPGFVKTPWIQSAAVVVQDEVSGRLNVLYTEERPKADEGPFLKEERKLINAVAEQLGFYILHQQLRKVFNEEDGARQKAGNEWEVILDLLKRTDPKLLVRISRKMINHLGWQGVDDAENLLGRFFPASAGEEDADTNRPSQQQPYGAMPTLSNEVFATASKYMSHQAILDNIRKWVQEERLSFLMDILEKPGSSLFDISSALERYHHLVAQGFELSPAREQWLRVALVRRILSDQSRFIEIAKHYIDVNDFGDFMHRLIYSTDSHGQLGGKGSGLFLATQILKKSPLPADLLQDIKIPKTWYLMSDGILYFMSYNNMEEVVEQKYKDLELVRKEYPYIIHIFKDSPLPPEIVKALSLALEDLGDVPLIVRSSSLLEDQVDAVFAGKYKSLFIANKGTKKERLAALTDAITEVYASLFGPDPIQYRIEHGFMDYHEEMGILIQEVVGKQVGRYFLPAFAGVAFSNNEFRWSSRIKREDGLVRMVPGLGTRAVDRLSDDYPVLVSPGQPGLRVNVTADEIVYYSPRKIDVINLETRSFETMDIRDLLKECGSEYPLANQVVSVLNQEYIQTPGAFLDFEADSMVVTFEGLFTRTPFLKQMQLILKVLQEAFNHPVDIEFAHDGTNFYLLQCRAQPYSKENISITIPRDISREKIVFTANRFVSNGRVDDIAYIVYVDPQKYHELSNYQDLAAVGRAVGRLNKILPKRRFVLIGPGRWGSRGDIKLGVSVTYSDINNTAALIEIARKKKNYVPELSFGTHFFQDLVEASISYLPLYPDDPGVIYNERFLTGAPNLLKEMIPELEPLSDVVRVIHVPASADGQVLRLLMSADAEEAMAYLVEPSEARDLQKKRKKSLLPEQSQKDTHWHWRLQAVESMAAHLDAARFGVKNFYVFGSTKNATAGPQSDIDILIHFRGTAEQRNDLSLWLEGWSASLSQINFERTGLKTDGLLDVHLITDEDIVKGGSYASKIGALTDAARLLPMGTALKH